MAANSYTNARIYFLLKKNASLPRELEFLAKEPGEGANTGSVADRAYYKNMFVGEEGWNEIEALVDARRAGVLEVKTPKQILELREQVQPQPIER